MLISLFPAISLFRAISLNFEKQFQEMKELIIQGFLHTILRQFGSVDGGNNFKKTDNQQKYIYRLIQRGHQ